MVSQIGVVVTETASHDRRTIIEKHVIQAGDIEDRKRFRVKNDFAARDACLPARVGIHPRGKGRKYVLIEWRRSAKRIVDANRKRLGDNGSRPACGYVRERSRDVIDCLSHRKFHLKIHDSLLLSRGGVGRPFRMNPRRADRLVSQIGKQIGRIGGLGDVLC